MASMALPTVIIKPACKVAHKSRKTTNLGLLQCGVNLLPTMAANPITFKPKNTHCGPTRYLPATAYDATLITQTTRDAAMRNVVSQTEFFCGIRSCLRKHYGLHCPLNAELYSCSTPYAAKASAPTTVKGPASARTEVTAEEAGGWAG